MRAGHRDAADRKQVVDREMKPDAEHQQDDAELGQLRRNLTVGDISRRERADHDTRQEIADQRRQPQPVGGRAEKERQHEAGDDRRNERRSVPHSSSWI